LVWVFIGDNGNWFIHTKFMSDGEPDETWPGLPVGGAGQPAWSAHSGQ